MPETLRFRERCYELGLVAAHQDSSAGTRGDSGRRRSLPRASFFDAAAIVTAIGASTLRSRTSSPPVCETSAGH